MQKFSKIMEWAYLFVAVIFLVEVYHNWGADQQKVIVSVLMAALAVFMFVFKRRFRNKRSQK